MNKKEPTNEELVADYQSGNEAALTTLVVRNDGLVYKFALKYYNRQSRRPIEIEDVAQVGRMAMVRAARTFDANRGVKFSTFAGNYIIHEILNDLRKHTGVIHVPPDGISRPTYVAKKKAARKVESIDYTEGFDLHDRGDRHVGEDLERREEKEILDSALRTLSGRDEDVMRRRLKGHTLKAIGEALGVTKERVRQIETRARVDVFAAAARLRRVDATTR